MKIILTLLAMASIINAQEISNNTRPWKGNAILGNGNICAVYSDDPRIIKESGSKGIQHFYYKNYTADYISSAYINVNSPIGRVINKTAPDKTGMKDFFAVSSSTTLLGGIDQKLSCFVMPYDAAIISLELNNVKIQQEFIFTVKLRKPQSVKSSNGIVTAKFSNGTLLSIAPASGEYKIETNGDSLINFIGAVPLDINNSSRLEFIISAASDASMLSKNITRARSDKNLFVTAKKHWNKWVSGGKLPRKYIDEFKRNIYAARSASLNGEIPADITGQFVTNGMPQLYPRDAMMCARVFMAAGHFEEAKQVIQFWEKSSIPKKSKGEFYARYDAFAKAVDGGSGARYNEPEWDANGYLIKLVYDYYKQKKDWLIKKEFIFELADFLVSKIDKSGLLYEGGIVEWSGYLPATNMNCAAGLKSASEIASLFKESRSKKYFQAYNTISENLKKMFDKKRNTYADVRFKGKKTSDGTSAGSNATKDTLYLWDASMNFGVLWGYPDHEEVKLSNKFYQDHTTKLDGGLQYFEAPDPGLAGYGNDVFFFVTAGAAQYEAMYGSRKQAEEYIHWMIDNSNTYGLMPERIYLNESDCSPASPLSWCCAEFAAALLLL